MRLRPTLAAGLLLLLALATVRTANGQDPMRPSTEDRVAELEKKLAEQQKELDGIKSATPSATKPASGPQTFDWGWKDGFFVEGEINGTHYELRPRVRLQLDYRAFPDSSRNLQYKNVPPEDQFVMRRGRVGFDGVFGAFRFQLEVDPTRGLPSGLPLGDFWFQYEQFEAFKVRFGHYKAPFTLEDGMTSDLYLDTIERSMVGGSGNSVAPDFRPGAEILGKLGGGIFNYWISAQNQPDSNTVTTGDPLFTARVQSDFGPFSVGAAGLWARLGGAPGTSFPGRTPGQFQFFAPVAVRGWEQAYTVDLTAYSGPFWAAGEFTWAQQDRNRVLADNSDGTPLVTQGFYTTFGYMFCGPSSKGPHGVPFSDWQFFSTDLTKHKNARNVGAELLVRFEWMDLENARGGRRFTSASETTPAFPTVDPKAAKIKGNDAKAITVGLNIYPVENVKFMIDYIHLRTGDASRAERAHSRQADELMMRAQLEF